MISPAPFPTSGIHGQRGGARADRRYSAPGVLANPGSATEASDIYSPGIVFHELAGGIAPDGAADSRAALDTETVAKAIEATGPSGIGKSPEDVAGVIARMGHPEPGGVTSGSGR